MKKAMRLMPVLVLGLLLAAMALPGCAVSQLKAQNTPFTIDYPVEGVVLSSSITLVKGTVLSAGCIVTVQGNEAHVDSRGIFYGYAFLEEGDNSIEVRANSVGRVYSKNVNVTFRPPLVVYLDYPRSGIDYLENPLTVTGFVSNPQAVVTINGLAAAVSANGGFSLEIQLKPDSNRTITATASLGCQTDTDSYSLSTYQQGKLLFIPPPGPIHFFHTELERIIYLNAGDSTVQEIELKDYEVSRIPVSLNYSVKPIALVNNNFEPAPWPDGLNIKFMPSNFTVYPKSSSSSLMVIEASESVAQGEYYFEFNTFVDQGRESGTIKIVVLPDEGAIEKSIEVNQSQTANGITFSLERLEFSERSFKVSAFNTSPGYSMPKEASLPPPLNMPPPELMALVATAEYRVDGGPPISLGPSGINFFEDGMWHTWNSDIPVPAGSKEFEFTITSLGKFRYSWQFKVTLV